MADEEILSQEEVSRIILEITLGERIVEFDYPHETHPSTLILKQPNGRDKLWADFVEKKSLNEAVSMGLPREDQIPEELVEQFFSREDQGKLESLHKKVEAYQKMVDKGIQGSAVHTQNKQKLSQLKDDLNQLKSKKDLARQLTADFKATEDRYYFLMSRCVLNINREPLWNSLEELEQESDIGYLEALLYQEFLPFFVGYGTRIIRYIARSGQWGTRFHAARNTGMEVFSCLPEDLSVDQLVLLSWSTFYFDISQMAEEYKPSEEIISDDEALDEYLDKLSQRMKAERRERRKNTETRKKGKRLNSEDHQNVIVTANNRDYVGLYKRGDYSDPKDLTRRVKDPTQSTSYSESAAARERKKQLRSKKRAQIKNLFKDK